MDQRRIVLLGLGMQGKAVLYDLIHNTDVSQIVVADNNTDLMSDLRQYPSDRVAGRGIDATDESALASVMVGADVVIESLPGVLALTAGRVAARVGVHLVSSMYLINPGEQDATKIQMMKAEVEQIDRQAKEKAITILTEFGLDPGIDLVLGAKALEEMDEVHEFYSYGAGLPNPDAVDNSLKYKFSWSVIGVMRAYLRPAKIISQGRVIEIEAREMFAPKNVHMLDLEEMGSPLECYPNGNSEHYAEVFGLKSTIKEMGRYACRYPGHCAFWETFVKSGFLDEKPIRVGDTDVIPMEFTASLLESQEQFYFADDEQDIVLVRIDVRGFSEGKRKRIVYQLIDRRDLETGFTAMQRTVGFTMGLGGRLILDGVLKKPGLLSPIDVPFDLVAEGLKTFGMSITRQEFPWEKEKLS